MENLYETEIKSIPIKKISSQSRNKKQNDYLDQVGPVHLSYQYLLDGVSDFVWCKKLSNTNSDLKESHVGFAYSNSGELLYTQNGGLDWEFISLKVRDLDLKLVGLKDRLPFVFEIREITNENKGMIYFITSSQHILISENCSNKLIVMDSISKKSELSIDSVLVHKYKPFHLLALVDELICQIPLKCYYSKVLYYSQNKTSSWIRLMQDIESVVWAEGIHSFDSFGILVILNESVNFEIDQKNQRFNNHEKTVAVYSNNFFIDKFR